MKAIDQARFAELLHNTRIKPRLKRELRFGASVADISAENWAEMELISIAVRSGNEGVLLLDLEGLLYILPYELSGRLTDQKTGRSQAIICDLCATWQAGGNATTVTFTNVATGNKHTLLCCADLKCSLHVRTKTSESRRSRTQLREDLTNEQRAERLRHKLMRLVSMLSIQGAN